MPELKKDVRTETTVTYTLTLTQEEAEYMYDAFNVPNIKLSEPRYSKVNAFSWKMYDVLAAQGVGSSVKDA